MIELICSKCGATFERRGYKRGKKPHCKPCQIKAEYERIKGGNK